ncbi:uncharacterized protein LOC142343182 isoform X2 [Convolutriloba macropyga]|uniref:uncharacterized protein LOC142343182 isoform X2 n=1 Tax=Convolutriloba macropyga TaxID=536237 RepID=UPI003F526AD7
MSGASDDFARAVLKKSVAKVCVELGYSSINGSSLEVMLDLVEDFFRKFGFLMRVNAEDYNERCYNEADDAFYALDQLGMTVDELFSCVHDFNPGSLPVDIPLFPVPLDAVRTEPKLREGEGFFDPSIADEDDIRAAIEADQKRQALKAKEEATPAKSKSTLPDGQSRSGGKRIPSDKPSVSPSKPPTLNVSQLTPGVSNSRQSLSPISAELAPVTVTGGGMLPTSVTLTYEESKDVSNTPMLTPKKVAILKQNLLKKVDSSETPGESSTGTISRKLRLGIDAGVGSAPTGDREKSPPLKESYVPEVTDVVSKSSAPIVPASTTALASAAVVEKTTTYKKTQKDAQSSSAAPLVKTLPIPPPNAKAASAIDHETETGKVVEVKSGFVIKMDKSKVLPVFQFPAIPPLKQKIPKKKEAPPKMQIKLGTLLTEKQKIKLSAQIQQEQEQIQGRSVPQVKSEASEESSEVSSQFSQEEETTSEQFDDSSTVDSTHDMSERLPEIPGQMSDLSTEKQYGEPIFIKVENENQSEATSYAWSEQTAFSNQLSPENITAENSHPAQVVPKDEPPEPVSNEQFRPTVISVKSCTATDDTEFLSNNDVEPFQEDEHQLPNAYADTNFREFELPRTFAEPSGSVNDLEDLRTPMIPDTPDLSTPREKFVAMFNAQLLPKIKEESLASMGRNFTSDESRLPFLNDEIPNTDYDEGVPETPPELKESVVPAHVVKRVAPEERPTGSVIDLLEPTAADPARPLTSNEITQPTDMTLTNNLPDVSRQSQPDMTSSIPFADVVDIGEETDAESDDEKPSSPNLDVLPTLKHTSELDALTSTDSNIQPPALEHNIPPPNTTISAPNIITIESDGEIEIPPSPNLIPLTPSTSNEIPRSPNLDADLNSGPNSVGPNSPQSSADFNPVVATSSYATNTTAPNVPFQLMSQNLRAATDVSGPPFHSETIQTPPSPNLIDETESRTASSYHEAAEIDTARLDSVLDLGIGGPQLNDDVSVSSYDSNRKTTDVFAEKEKSGKKRKHSSEHKSKKKHKKAKRELAEVEELDEESLMGDEDDGMVPVLPKLILKFGGKSVTIGNECGETSRNSEPVKVPEIKSEPLPSPERPKTPTVLESAPASTKKPQSAKKQKEEQSMRDLLAKAEMMHQATSSSVQSLSIKAPLPVAASGDLQSPITPVGIRDCDFTNTSPNLPPLVGTAPEYHPPAESYNIVTSASSTSSASDFARPASSAFGEIGGSDGVPGSDVIGDVGSADQQVWICPACGLPDTAFDSPMIGCDLCDGWYHWQCLGILMEPTSEKWYCPKCTKNNSKSTSSSASSKKKGKKTVSRKR